MKTTKQVADELSEILAISPALLVQFIIALLQAASICLPVQTPPEDAIQKLAVRNPRRVERLIDRISRRKRIPTAKRGGLKVQLLSMLSDSKNKKKLSMICAEIL